MYMSKLVSKLDQRGVAHLLLLVLLVVGLIAGVYLITKGPLNFFPKASLSKPVGPENSFTLVGPSGCTAGILCVLYGQHAPQEEFAVNLYARSDIETANLFTAKMTFPKDLVEVKEIVTAPTQGNFIKNWVETFYDNNTGEISLTGGVPSPGYQTTVGGESAQMATIVFRAKAIGKGTVAFTDSSAIYSNRNNINILSITRSYDIVVEVKPSPSPVSGPVGKCTYGSTQARLQKDLSDPWTNSKTINAGDKIRVGGFHNNTGLLAPDVKLNVVGQKSCSPDTNVCTQASFNPTNGDFITPPVIPGTYTLTVTTQGQIGSACQDTATFQVQKCTVRPPCLYAKPACAMPEPETGWCPAPGNKGDGNSDGKINLIDMSVIHTDWMRTSRMSNFRVGIDMNNDGLINTFDYSLHRNLLLQLGVIKSR